MKQENKKNREFTMSIGITNSEVPLRLVELVNELEEILGLDIWLIVQNDEPYNQIDNDLAVQFYRGLKASPDQRPVGLLIDSPGGYAASAYKIATSIRKIKGEFTAIVPFYAKSAATLLVLGADKIFLGCNGELGPLDAQFEDREREAVSSGLDEVQALQRLLAFSMEAVDSTMILLLPRTGKKVETLLPIVLKFVSDLTRPLFESIDTVHYTQMSRVVKVAEEYAKRLLQPHYDVEQAKSIVSSLVEKYPEHGFIIDEEEACKIGIQIQKRDQKLDTIIDEIIPFIQRHSYIGKIVEVKNESEG